MTTDQSPTARALLALEAIQARPGITGDELASRLRVSDRAARRYVGILREAGMPVESATGPYGGYRIGRGARVPPLMFTPEEALGLVMAVLRGWHGPVDSDQPAASALGKITRVLPQPAAASAEAMRRVVAQNPSDAAATPDSQRTADLARACESGHRVRLVYRSSASRPPREMVVDPWAVVVRHGRWYLLCWSRSADGRRVLRLDRVERVDVTADACEVPAGLDPVREVEEHLAVGWAHEVEVHLEVGFDVASRCVPRSLGRLEAVDEHRCVLRGSTDEPGWYAGQLAALELPFTLVGSAEVAAELRALAERLVRAVPGAPASS
ncbi:WYL domain-containing protein [Nocardioides sp. KIGAM211]|uniref:WYL domain-containing protein n=1 Tax=Nocardioides luti TaxID=2761101 RepID=A0A7X0RCT7_9ACTN|nr:WYL domain-containing protein [Nocardioides luti]MBB6625870.1 WYL domain-containing protein [Nocardioides luti]